jgi:hypothetical protein
MLDPHDPSPLSEADLERVRTQLREALERLRDTVERTQRAFYEMRLRVAESTSDNPASEGRRIFASAEAAPRSALEDAFQDQRDSGFGAGEPSVEKSYADEIEPWSGLPSRAQPPRR